MRYILSILISLFILNSCNQPTSKTAANKTINVAIEGMTCAEGCAKHIQETISEMPGVTQSKVNFDQKLALFAFDSTKVNTQEILQKIGSLNEGQYKANLVGAELPATEKNATTEEAVEVLNKEEAHS
ncbi:MAG: cation transporter [Bacteroidia bacterium]|nr:cation transporter [Bacteroidia bacterium]